MALKTSKRAHVEAVHRVLDTFSLLDLRADLGEDPLPGQFIMLYTMDSEEIPMAVMDYRDGLLRIGNRVIGPSTKKLYEARCGDYFSIRGPYGSHFETDHVQRALLAAGGIGLTSIHYLAKRRRRLGLETDTLLAFRWERETVLTRLLEPLPSKVITHIDESGADLADTMRDLLSRGDYGVVAANGPEGFLHLLWRLCEEYGVASQFSLARWMKCGVGICGSCIMDGKGSSIRVCVEGPVLTSEVLRRLTDLGRYEYDESGGKVELQDDR